MSRNNEVNPDHQAGSGTAASKSRDAFWMQRALQLARQAEAMGEVPVGAVVVLDDELIGEGYNQPIGSHDPTAHAEIVALRNAGQRMGNYRLPAVTLYVTLEPCTMCAGAMIHARVARLVFGAADPRTGAAGSVYNVFADKHHNHRIEVEGGLMGEESAAMLQAFFRARR